MFVRGLREVSDGVFRFCFQEDEILERAVAHTTVRTMWADYEDFCDGHVGIFSISVLRRNFTTLFRYFVLFCNRKTTRIEQ